MKHTALMSHNLLAEKHQQLLLKNAESRPARKVHSIVVDQVVPAGPVGHADTALEAHATEAFRRLPKGSYRKSQPLHMAREMRAYGKSNVHKGYNKRDVQGRKDQPRPRSNPYKPRNFQPRQSHVNCHRCGRKGHFAKNCRFTILYIFNIYRELQQLRNQPRQTYNFKNPNPNPPSFNDDIENHMTIYKQHSNPNEAILDSASTHTILTDPKFCHFRGNDELWKHCKIITMARSYNSIFWEGRATVILLGGFPLNCKRAMYAPDAPRSLISYKDLKAKNIHVSIAVKNDEKVLELRQGLMILATVRAGDDGLYKIVINSLDNENSSH